jgi:uncharacterized protein
MKTFFIRALCHLNTRHSVLVIISTLILSFGLGYGATLLKFNDDYRVYFSKDNVDLVGWEQILDRFSRSDSLIITVEEKDHNSIFNPETLPQLIELTEKLWTVKYVTRVDSITNFQHIYTQNDEIIVEDLFSEENVRDQQEIQSREIIARNEISINKRMLSEKGNVTSIQLQMMIPKKENAIADAAASARAIQAEFEKKYPNIDLRLGGIVMLNAAFDEYARADMATLFPIMLLVFFVGITLLLRSTYLTMCIMISIFSSVSATFGVSGFLGIEFSPHSSIAPHIVFTVAIAMAIHLVISYAKAYSKNQNREEAMLACLNQNLVPVFISAATTALGFLSMQTSEIPPFRDLGVMCSLGLLFSFINTVSLLLAFISLKKKVTLSPTIEHMSNFGAYIGRKLISNEFKFVTVSICVTAICLVGLVSLKVDDHPIKLFEKGTEFRDDADFIDANLAGTTDIQFALDSKNPQGIINPEYLIEVEEFKAYLLNQDRVTHVQVLTDTIKRVNRALHDDNPDYFRLGTTDEENAQSLLFYETNLPFGQELNNEIDINKSQIRLIATIKSSSSSQIVDLVSNANTWVEKNADHFEARGVSVLVMFSYMMDRLAVNTVQTIVLSLLLISFALMLVLKSLRLGMVSMIPNVLPILIVFGIWSYAGKTLDFSSVLIFSMTLGIIVDDTVHICSKYLQLMREEFYSSGDAVIETLRTMTPAVLVSSLVLCGGFLVFGFSVFHMNVTLGILSALTFAVGLLLDLILLPILLHRLIGIRLDRIRIKVGVVPDRKQNGLLPSAETA